MLQSWHRAPGGAQHRPRDSEYMGIVDLGGLSTGGMGISQDFPQSHCPTAQTIGGSCSLPLPLCQPCPRPPCSLVPAAGLTPFVLITGAKENSSVGKRSKWNSSALAGRAPTSCQAPVPAVPGCPAARPPCQPPFPPFQTSSVVVCCPPSAIPVGKEGFSSRPGLCVPVPAGDLGTID